MNSKILIEKLVKGGHCVETAKLIARYFFRVSNPSNTNKNDKDTWQQYQVPEDYRKVLKYHAPTQSP